MITKKADYYEELGKALRTRDIEELKRFFILFRNEKPTVSDKVLEISMHKMICNRTDMPEDLVMDSFDWLEERGLSPRI